jgi:hypothetical protein
MRSGAAAAEASPMSQAPLELAPDERADLEQALAEAEEDEREGRLVPAAALLERLRRAG